VNPLRVLVTGSSGQIGTNLALRLQREGHEVFGVDKRLNTWTDDFRYLLQDLSGHYPSYPGGIGGIDGGLIGTLIVYGAPAAGTAAAVLAYRVILFWLPLIVGGIAFARLRRDMPRPGELAACAPAIAAQRVTVSV